MKECITGAFKQLYANKFRTLLTMFGMIIGIGAVIMVLSVGEGAIGMVNDSFESVGKGLVEINVLDGRYENLITLQDREVIEDMIEVEDTTAYGYFNAATRDYENELHTFFVVAVEDNYDDVKDINLTGGRMISEADVKAKSRVAIVSDVFGKAMYGHQTTDEILGKRIEMEIDGVIDTFEVVGLVESNYFEGMPLENVFLQIYMPFSTVTELTGNGVGKAYNIGVNVNENYNPTEVGYQVTRLLDKQHSTHENYSAKSVLQEIEQAKSVVNNLTLFVGFVAGISLLVGGIGIMNIMLVTVKERTREIGIRKAIGATNKAILAQFLTEAIIITLIGGFIGILLGYGGGLVIGIFMGLNIQLTISMIAFSVGTSSFVGILFGVYPAHQASKLDPIEALRHE
ncbi:MAG: hypothetical protein ATN32_10615 [Candidatus Epulonipiscium fishelsonii]|nr:MAG: hypothetical protein ATN32_10615 [Epulopiscium sp. AS2M-Bin002]